MEKIWLNNYPQGIPHEITTNGKTLASLFDETCEKFSKNQAISCHGVTKNFKDVHKYVESMAASLVELGVKKGDRVAVIMPNIMHYPITIFAILKIGAVVVNINPLYTASEMEYLLENSGTKVAVILNVMANKLNDLYKKGLLENIIVAKIPDPYPLIKRILINFVIKYIKRLDISYTYPAHDYFDMLNGNKKLSYDPEISENDLAFIQYTGATTGKPKGAMLLHRNVVANITQIHAWLLPQIGEDKLDKQVVISALPLYHIFSLTANLFTFFFSGSENVMVPNPRDIKETMKVLKKVPFTIFNALDTLYAHLLNSKEFLENKYPSFKYSVAGGMPSRDSTVKKWHEVTGVTPSNCYGLTETSPAVTMNPIDGTYDGSVGFPIPSTEIQVRDINTHVELPLGEIGVIYVRGPQVTNSYWNNKEQTLEAFDKDGWFNTKDLGYINNKGKLYLTGRQSEMIILSGFNVYPAEVESVLDSMPQIKEAAVIGIPDPDTGEAVVAYVVLNPGAQIDEIEIRKLCKEKLTSYKVPRHIIISEELPKTLVGKIDKVALTKRHLKESD